MSKLSDWPGSAFVPGSRVLEFDSGRIGVVEGGGYIRFEDVRIAPSAAARLWGSNKIAVAPLRGNSARAYKARARAAESVHRVSRVKTGSTRSAVGPYGTWKQAAGGGFAAANNRLVALTGSPLGNGPPEHVSGCQTAMGSGRMPGTADLARCNGCWVEQMSWVTRLDALGEVCRAFRAYLRDSVNEFLASEHMWWGSLTLLLVVPEGPSADRDWNVLVTLHKLLGTRLGSEAQVARRLGVEQEMLRELEPTSPEHDILAARLRDECLAPGGLEGLVGGMDRAVERVSTRVRRLADPDGDLRRDQFVTAALERGILDVRIRPSA